MAWAEVGSGSQRATKNGVIAPSTTLAFPGNVTAGDLLVVIGMIGGDPVSEADLTPIVTDTRGTTYTVLTTPTDGFFSGTWRRYVAYGIAPNSGANTVTVASGAGATVFLSFSIDEFSGILVSNPFHSTASAGIGETAIAIAGTTLGWTITTGFVHEGMIAAAFRPSLSGPALIVAVLSVWSLEAITWSANSPAIEIGSDESFPTGIINHNAAFRSGETVSADPVDYEDPCSIESPVLFAVIRTEDEDYKVSVRPLRETAAQGGYGVPRLLEMSPVVKPASDPFTGGLSAQSVTISNADTDRVLRAATLARRSLRHCDATMYLTSKARSLAGGPPRVLLAGKVYQDSAEANLVHGITINDPIGAGLSITSDEAPVPARVVGVTHFPKAPSASLGKAEPPIVGRRAPLSEDSFDGVGGVVPCIPVGLVNIGGTFTTPDSVARDAMFDDLEAAYDAGRLDAEFGSALGHGDMQRLQGLPFSRSWDFWVANVGGADMRSLVQRYAVTGGQELWCFLIAAHAIKEILDFDGNPSIWINEEQLDAGRIGVDVWCPQIPGDTSWTSTFGSDRFTDIVGTDGVTRRYTLIAFDPDASYDGGTFAEAFEGGARVHVDLIGAERSGNGLGDAITEYFEGYEHILRNFGLQTYLSGPWLSSPTFLFADGVTVLDRIDLSSFARAAAVWAVRLSGGLVGSFYLGDGVTLRSFIQEANVSGGCLFAQDDFGRYVVKVFDNRRSEFLVTRSGVAHRTLVDKYDFLPGFKVLPRPEWQCNVLTIQYARNDYAGRYERDGTGGAVPVENAESRVRHGDRPQSREYVYLRDDASARAVGGLFVELFGSLPFVATWTRRGLCGLEDDVLDGVSVTHYNGLGEDGDEEAGYWIFGRSFRAQMCADFTALRVEELLDPPEPTVFLRSDPVTWEFLIADDGSGRRLIRG